MIKFVDSEKTNIKKICSNDVFGTKIEGYFNAYGCKFDFLKFWIQLDENENQTAAICRIDGEMFLTCLENADFEELAFFINMTGFVSLMCKTEIMNHLGFDAQNSGCIVEYKSLQNSSDDNISLNVDYKQYYSIIKNAGILGVGEYLPWLSDFSYRVKKGVASPAVINADGKTVSCASALFITENAALLGAVATMPEYKNKGYAGNLVKYIGNSMLKQNKKVELMCKKGSIINFYCSIGFCLVGEWSMTMTEKI